MNSRAKQYPGQHSITLSPWFPKPRVPAPCATAAPPPKPSNLCPAGSRAKGLGKVLGGKGREKQKQSQKQREKKESKGAHSLSSNKGSKMVLWVLDSLTEGGAGSPVLGQVGPAPPARSSAPVPVLSLATTHPSTGKSHGNETHQGWRSTVPMASTASGDRKAHHRRGKLQLVGPTLPLGPARTASGTHSNSYMERWEEGAHRISWEGWEEGAQEGGGEGSQVELGGVPTVAMVRSSSTAASVEACVPKSQTAVARSLSSKEFLCGTSSGTCSANSSNISLGSSSGSSTSATGSNSNSSLSAASALSLLPQAGIARRRRDALDEAAFRDALQVWNPSSSGHPPTPSTATGAQLASQAVPSPTVRTHGRTLSATSSCGAPPFGGLPVPLPSPGPEPHTPTSPPGATPSSCSSFSASPSPSQSNRSCSGKPTSGAPGGATPRHVMASAPRAQTAVAGRVAGSVAPSPSHNSTPTQQRGAMTPPPHGSKPPSSSPLPILGDMHGGVPVLHAFSSGAMQCFTLAQLEVATGHFAISGLLGVGGFGGVYKGVMFCRERAKRVSVAVKVLNTSGDQGHKEWLTEVGLLARLSHPCLVPLLGFCSAGEHRLLVYPFLPGGALERALFAPHLAEAKGGLAHGHRDREGVTAASSSSSSGGSATPSNRSSSFGTSEASSTRGALGAADNQSGAGSVPASPSLTSTPQSESTHPTSLNRMSPLAFPSSAPAPPLAPSPNRAGVGGILGWQQRVKVAVQACKGLKYLHEEAEHKVIYRDFKTSNVLLDHQGNALLSDFGLARDGPEGERSHVTTRVVGTVGYAAPEYVLTGHLSTRSDVWSFGVVLLELLTGRPALDKSRVVEEQSLVDWATPYVERPSSLYRIMDPALGGMYSVKGAQLMAAVVRQCLQKRPKERPRMGQVLQQLMPATEFRDLAGFTPSVPLGGGQGMGMQWSGSSLKEGGGQPTPGAAAPALLASASSAAASGASLSAAGSSATRPRVSGSSLGTDGRRLSQTSQRSQQGEDLKARLPRELPHQQTGLRAEERQREARRKTREEERPRGTLAALGIPLRPCRELVGLSLSLRAAEDRLRNCQPASVTRTGKACGVAAAPAGLVGPNPSGLPPESRGSIKRRGLRSPSRGPPGQEAHHAGASPSPPPPASEIPTAVGRPQRTLSGRKYKSWRETTSTCNGGGGNRSTAERAAHSSSASRRANVIPSSHSVPSCPSIGTLFRVAPARVKSGKTEGAPEVGPAFSRSREGGSGRERRNLGRGRLHHGAAFLGVEGEGEGEGREGGEREGEGASVGGPRLSLASNTGSSSRSSSAGPSFPFLEARRRQGNVRVAVRNCESPRGASERGAHVVVLEDRWSHLLST